MRVVITGGTRGLGLAMAREFCRAGDSVFVTSRTPAAVAQAVHVLQQESAEPEHVHGTACDVADHQHVTALVDSVREAMQGCDVWINNAAIDGVGPAQDRQPFIDVAPEAIAGPINTNLTGLMYCTHAAMRMMTNDGGGQIFNMTGRGGRGEASPDTAVYGASKAAVQQFTATMAKETKGTAVGVHLLSPGMVLTPLLVKPGMSRRVKRIFNILAETPETVAAWLVPRIRRTSGTGQRIMYLTPVGVLLRFLTWWRFRNKHFDESTDDNDDNDGVSTGAVHAKSQ